MTDGRIAALILVSRKVRDAGFDTTAQNTWKSNVKEKNLIYLQTALQLFVMDNMSG